jgi:iron complex outermembrane receptor protein
MKNIKLFFIFYLCFSAKIMAQSDTLYKSEVSELMQMKQAEASVKITSATKTEQEIAEAPNLVNVVLRKQILQYGYICLNDILFRQVGTSVSQDYDRTTVSMRGTFENWNTNHWLVLIDGVPFNGNTYGSAFTQEVTPLIFSQSVEILRGAGSALYGGGAMHGVVSVNTTEVSDLKGNSEGRVRVGARGEQIYDIMAGAENNNISILTAFNHYQTQGNNYESYDGSGRITSDSALAKFKTNHALSSNYFFGKI